MNKDERLICPDSPCLSEEEKTFEDAQSSPQSQSHIKTVERNLKTLSQFYGHKDPKNDLTPGVYFAPQMSEIARKSCAEACKRYADHMDIIERLLERNGVLVSAQWTQLQHCWLDLLSQALMHARDLRAVETHHKNCQDALSKKDCPPVYRSRSVHYVVASQEPLLTLKKSEGIEFVRSRKVYPETLGSMEPSQPMYRLEDEEALDDLCDFETTQTLLNLSRALRQLNEQFYQLVPSDLRLWHAYQSALIYQEQGYCCFGTAPHDINVPTEHASSYLTQALMLCHCGGARMGVQDDQIYAAQDALSWQIQTYFVGQSFRARMDTFKKKPETINRERLLQCMKQIQSLPVAYATELFELIYPYLEDPFEYLISGSGLNPSSRDSQEVWHTYQQTIEDIVQVAEQCGSFSRRETAANIFKGLSQRRKTFILSPPTKELRSLSEQCAFSQEERLSQYRASLNDDDEWGTESTPEPFWRRDQAQLATWQNNWQVPSEVTDLFDHQEQQTHAAMKILSDMLQEIVQQLGEPPCPFEFLALGSMSRLELTPCSDLDIGLLIAQAQYRQHDYFKQLILYWKARMSFLPDQIWVLDHAVVSDILDAEGLLCQTPESVLTYCLPDVHNNPIKAEIYSLRRARHLFAYPQIQPSLLQSFHERLHQAIHVQSTYRDLGFRLMQESFDLPPDARAPQSLKRHTIKPLVYWIAACARYAGIPYMRTDQMLTQLVDQGHVPQAVGTLLQKTLARLQSLRIGLHLQWLKDRGAGNATFDLSYHPEEDGVPAAYRLSHETHQWLQDVHAIIIKPLRAFDQSVSESDQVCALNPPFMVDPLFLGVYDAAAKDSVASAAAVDFSTRIDHLHTMTLWISDPSSLNLNYFHTYYKRLIPSKQKACYLEALKSAALPGGIAHTITQGLWEHVESGVYHVQDPNKKLGAVTPSQWMRQALIEKREDLFWLGLQRWSDLNCWEPCQQKGHSLLHAAVISGPAWAVRQIIDRCPPEIRNQLGTAWDKQGKKLLFYAIAQPDPQILKILVEKAGITVQGLVHESRGSHALHVAAFFGKHQHMAFLCRHGADMQAKDKKNQTPFDVALRHHPSLAGCLSQHSAKIHPLYDALCGLLAREDKILNHQRPAERTQQCIQLAEAYAQETDRLQDLLVEHMDQNETQKVADLCLRMGDAYYNQALLYRMSDDHPYPEKGLMAFEQAALYYNAGIRHQSGQRAWHRLIALEVSVLDRVLHRSYMPDVYCTPESLRQLLASSRRYAGRLLSGTHTVTQWLSQNDQLIKTLWVNMLHEAQRLLGSSPCPFILMGFGALSRGELTLSSGIKWGILLPQTHDSDRDHPYFVQLAQWIQLKTCHWGQTPLIIDQTGLSLTPQGIHIHAAYTPLGHGGLGRVAVHESGAPRLIGSVHYWVETLMALLWSPVRTGPETKEYEEKQHFFHMLLSATCLAASQDVTSPEQWIAEYKMALKKRLYVDESSWFQGFKPNTLSKPQAYHSEPPQTETHTKKPTHRRNLTHSMRINPKMLSVFQANSAQNPGKTWALALLKKHLQTTCNVYGTLVNCSENQGYHIKELYRMLGVLVHDLALYYGIDQGSTLEALEALKNQKIIHPNLHAHLTSSWLIIMKWRIQLQYHYGSQWTVIAQHPVVGDAPPVWPKPDPLLMNAQCAQDLEQVYSALLPFYDGLAQWESNPQENPLIRLDVHSTVASDYFLNLAKARIAEKNGHFDAAIDILSRMQGLPGITSWRMALMLLRYDQLRRLTLNQTVDHIETVRQAYNEQLSALLALYLQEFSTDYLNNYRCMPDQVRSDIRDLIVRKITETSTLTAQQRTYLDNMLQAYNQEPNIVGYRYDIQHQHTQFLEKIGQQLTQDASQPVKLRTHELGEKPLKPGLSATVLNAQGAFRQHKIQSSQHDVIPYPWYHLSWEWVAKAADITRYQKTAPDIPNQYRILACEADQQYYIQGMDDDAKPVAGWLHTLSGFKALNQAINALTVTPKQPLSPQDNAMLLGHLAQDCGMSPAPQFYIKKDPEMPGMSYLVASLYERIIGHGVAPMVLGKLLTGQGEIVISISDAITGTPFNQQLNQDPQSVHALDFKKFSQWVLMALLVVPEDDKPSNWVWVHSDPPTLVNVDYDHALFEEGQTDYLHLRSILLCLDQMRQPIHPEAREAFLQQDPELILRHFLLDAQTQNLRYRELFAEEDIQRFSIKSQGLIPIPIKSGDTIGIYERYTQLQEVLKAQANVSLLHLFTVLFPRMALKYLATFDQSNPFERFFQLYESPLQASFEPVSPSRLKAKVKQWVHSPINSNTKAVDRLQGTQTAVVKSLKILTDKLYLSDKTFLKEIEPAKGLVELDYLIYERRQLGLIRAALCRGDWQPLLGCKSSLYQEQILWGVVASDESRGVDVRVFGNNAQQKAFMKVIMEIRSLKRVCLSGLAQLSQRHFVQGLFNAWPDLQKLILKDYSCPNQKMMIAATKDRRQHSVVLTQLTLEGCDMSGIILNTPSLQRLTVRRCPNIRVVECKKALPDGLWIVLDTLDFACDSALQSYWQETVMRKQPNQKEDILHAIRNGHHTVYYWLFSCMRDHDFEGYLKAYSTEILACDWVPESPEIVGHLLAQKADPNVLLSGGKTPVYAAALRGYGDVVGCLLDAKADPNPGLSGYATGKMLGSDGIIQQLLAFNAHPDTLNEAKKTPLWVAALHGETQVIGHLLSAKADVNQGLRGYIEGLLIQERVPKSKAIIAQLLSYHADPEVVNSDKKTALYASALWGYSDIIRCLLDAKADPNPGLKGCITGMLSAAYVPKSKTIVEQLLLCRANPNISNAEQKTALYAAALLGYSDIAQCLLAAHADPNQGLLGYADGMSIKNHMLASTDIIGQLMAYRADPNMITESGKTVLYLATVYDYSDIRQSLLEAHADPNQALAGCTTLPWQGPGYPACGDAWMDHCHKNQRAFDQALKDFLQHIGYGNQAQAEAMLNKMPDLVLARGDITDYSNRTFHQITALQYSMWALDEYAFRMMMPYFKQLHAESAMASQSLEWKRVSQAYVGRDAVPMKSGTDHFDYEPTDQAYTAYIDHEERSYKLVYSQELMGLCYQGVGVQQSLWPAHMALEMTTEDRPFSPIKQVNFNQPKRPKEHAECNVAWFYAPDSYSDALSAHHQQHASACVRWRGNKNKAQRRYQASARALSPVTSMLGEVDVDQKPIRDLFKCDRVALRLLIQIRQRNLKALRDQAEACLASPDDSKSPEYRL